MDLSLQAAGRTDIGCVRSNNEDDFGYDLENGLFVVCDGMGGQVAGEVASKTAVESVLEYFRRTPLSVNGDEAGSTGPGDALREAVRFANEQIWHKAASNPNLGGMGSTIVAMLMRGSRAYIAHVGDSRVYLVRGGAIRQLTEDHSLVMEQVRRGMITREQAQRSEIQNIITRALGSPAGVEIDLQDFGPRPGDLLLLASDGLTRRVSDDELLQAIDHSSGLDAACASLVELARAAGGEDNITCLLVKVAGEA